MATTCLLTELYRIGVGRRPEALMNLTADQRLTALIILLSDLVQAAERGALETGIKFQPGRGGNRRAGQLTCESELLKAFIETYDELRAHFPDSGPQIAFDRPLREFVHSGVKLAVSMPQLEWGAARIIETPG